MPLGPYCVIMVNASKMPTWATNYHDQGVVDVDLPDEDGRLRELNALIDSGDAVHVPAKYVHVSSRATRHIRAHVEDDEDSDDMDDSR